ncbi:MAG TPA: ABC transporter permease [Puia sp.]|jgi:ABC-2 type transport system permease protein|nr:ABC transporter permease [Puia sp.]
MLKILKVEWMKVKNYRTFWILLGITAFSIPGISYMFYSLMNNSFPKGRRGAAALLGSPFAFPDIWQTATWNASLFFIIPAILVITLTTNEFTYKTHRQNIIDGWSRGQFIGVKLFEILLLSLFMTLLVFLTALGFGYIGNKVPDGISIWTESRFVIFYFVQVLTYTLIAFVLSMLIKRAGLAIGLYLLYLLVEQILVGIFRGYYKLRFAEYLPQETTDRLIPFPYAKGIIPLDVWEKYIPSYLGVAALYVLIYCLLTSRYFLKKDL